MYIYIYFLKFTFKSKITLVFGASKVVNFGNIFCVDPRIVGILY